ncbi:MAG TPA: DUF2905 family protein [Dehalococcoidia bacterium]|nr:DUF2905 family protein [Dehalococcoidia bacterium]
MLSLGDVGKLLLVAALFLAVMGVVLLFADRLPFVGKLPLDFQFKKGSLTIFFPLASFLLLSALLTIIINLALRLLGR